MSSASQSISPPLANNTTTPDSYIKNFNKLETIKKVLKVVSIILFVGATLTLSAFGIGHFLHMAIISSDILLSSSAIAISSSAILAFLKTIISQFQKKLPKPAISDEQITVEKLCQTLDEYNAKFPSIDPTMYIGKIEKIDLENGSKIVLKADLHGDFTSLLKHLKSLQKQGYLDENFKVVDKYKEKIVIAFLGDYLDRGKQSFKVINLLMKLKISNPNEIVLLKGNHENLVVSKYYIHPSERHFFDSANLCKKLDKFFSTLPLSMLLGTKDRAGNYQYTCLTHGALDPDVDLNQVLSKAEKRAEMLIKKNKKAHLSKRIKNILPPHLRDKKISEIRNVISALKDYIKSQSSINLKTLKEALLITSVDKKRAKLILSALKVQDFLMKEFLVPGHFSLPSLPIYSYIKESRENNDITSFSWGDISNERPLGPNNMRGAALALTPEFIKDYFRVINTNTRKVKTLRSGHFHAHKKFALNGKQGFIEILPVAGGLECYDELRKPVDFAQIVTIAPKVKNWIKQTLKRKREEDLHQISREKPFYKDALLSRRSWFAFLRGA